MKQRETLRKLHLGEALRTTRLSGCEIHFGNDSDMAVCIAMGNPIAGSLISWNIPSRPLKTVILHSYVNVDQRATPIG